jgi:two-component system, sporulation sensor kinase B
VKGNEAMTKDLLEKELPLYRKVLLFSFFITFLVVVSTAGMVFYYQSNQMEAHLFERSKEMSTIWSNSIPPDVVEDAMARKDEKSSSVKKLNTIISKLVKKNDDFYDGFAFITKKVKGKDIMFSTLSFQKGSKQHGFSTYTAGKEFLMAYNRSVDDRTLTVSGVYRDRNGMWITAFHPITNEEGEIIASFAVNVNAAKVEIFKRKMGLYLFISLIVVTSIVYFTLRWGIKKVFEPVQEIISGIKAVSAGNFNVKLQIKDPSDLAHLGENFNHMTENLSILFERLSDTYKEFGTMPSNIGRPHRIEEAIDEMEKIIAKTKIQKELQRAEKMNAIGQLAASVAHEIRNPMTVVRGFLQIFSAKEHLNEEELEYIQLMIDELNRAEVIINDYLSLAKPDFEQIVKVNASNLAANVMDLMNSFALMSNNIIIDKKMDDEVYIKGNESELKQVLINIVKNGIEAMKSGGVLKLKVKKSRNYGMFEISDTGIGMSAEELKRLGTAFYSLKEKGTGIGLMVCYQIVEKMKGTIDVESVIGQGTTFRVFIPLWDEEIV